MKTIGVVLLAIASIAVLVNLVLPVTPLILGFGIEVPSLWARAGKPHVVALYPFIALPVGLLLLGVFGWGIWKLVR